MEPEFGAVAGLGPSGPPLMVRGNAALNPALADVAARVRPRGQWAIAIGEADTIYGREVTPAMMAAGRAVMRTRAARVPGAVQAATEYDLQGWEGPQNRRCANWFLVLLGAVRCMVGRLFVG